MKHLAVIVAAIVALTLVAPAFAQPFADVPTDHWAYDAIAELAAKGLIEGYPDGAFRGDRAMTRYEMAMVVARLLARIEAIKIPPLPPDLVRTAQFQQSQAAQDAAIRALDQRLTAKLATIQRLVAEFRAELAALGVRVTAVEEELAAIRARLDNTKVTGDVRFRGNWFPTGSVSGGATQRSPDYRLRGRLTFTSQPTANPNVAVVIRLRADNAAGFSGDFADTSFGSGVRWNSVGFDLMYLDLKNTWAANLWRLGRQYYTQGILVDPDGGALLFDPADSAACGAIGTFLNGIPDDPTTPTVETARAFPYCTPGTADGLLSTWTLGPINVEVGLWRDQNFPTPGCVIPNPVPPPPPGTIFCPDPAGSPVGPRAPYFDYKTVRATTGALLPGWTLGGSYYDQNNFGFTPTADLPFLGGAAAGRGWGFDLSGTLMPGLTILIDWANWQARVQNQGGTVFTWPSASAWRVGGNIDLEKIAGITTWSPSIDWAYNNFGPLPVDPTFGMAPPPFYTYATTVFGQVLPWNMRGWMGKLNLTFSPKASAFIRYEGGTELASGLNMNYSEWWLRFTYRLTGNMTTYVQYTKGTIGGADFFNFYRAELSYRW